MSKHDRFARSLFLMIAVAGGTTLQATAVEPMAPRAKPKVEYARDVRPVLANHCFACHGADDKARKGRLRLDHREDALKGGRSRKAAIKPGRTDAGELLRRIDTADPADQMPPEDKGKPLTGAEKDLLRRWIEQGAEYQAHWALVPPQRPPLPTIKDRSWPRNGIDYFILARLEAEGLSPSPEADRATLVRRASLDLTGLPPTPAEVKAALDDASQAWFEKVVDRLLASPHYGERMALPWLDLARYADTNGYNNDEERTMWGWRDWVIDAFNDNMPYDRFVVEQVAGDLLPGATPQQRVATGFNRNHVFTTEGGIIPEEYRVEYVADRVHTTATALLGMSLQCARCHDHKYDPISQTEYYRFFAYFNSQPDQQGAYNAAGVLPPAVKAASRRQRVELAQLEVRRLELEYHRRQREAAAVPAFQDWLRPSAAGKEAVPTDLLLHLALDEKSGDKAHNTVSGGVTGVVRGKADWASAGPDRYLNFDGHTHIEIGQGLAPERTEAFTLAARVWSSGGDAMAILAKMDEGQSYRGLDFLLEQGKVAVHVIHHWPDNGLKVLTSEPLAAGRWHHVAVTYDGSGRAAGVKVYADGRLQKLTVIADRLTDSIRTSRPLVIGNRGQSLPFKGRMADVRIYGVELTGDDVSRLAEGKPVEGLKALAAVPEEKRTPQQRERLWRYFLGNVDLAYRLLEQEQEGLLRQKAALESAIPQTMVMQELPGPRPTHLLKRGRYDQPGEQVTPGTPSCLPPLPEGAPPNRLGLARWLVHPGHPLTARVAVNRWWEMYFGAGIVETVEDFGLQGALPSHPELLDWLATELVRTGWDVKAMQKTIVTSAAYRQPSHLTPLLLERDPRNRLLARGPRLRLPAEMLRDNALAISGLLSHRIGGPSVKPYQPAGLWQEVSVERRAVYQPSAGEDLYRRSMYTFWKRTCPPPSMSALDAPDRETCVVRRARTNTPLQALVLLNDPTYVEASRKLAERCLLEGGDSAEARLAYAFRMAVARPARPAEEGVLLPIYRKALDRFRTDHQAAEKLLAIGASPRNIKLDVAELAAWTTIASLVLNLDETITKE